MTLRDISLFLPVTLLTHRRNFVDVPVVVTSCRRHVNQAGITCSLSIMDFGVGNDRWWAQVADKWARQYMFTRTTGPWAHKAWWFRKKPLTAWWAHAETQSYPTRNKAQHGALQIFSTAFDQNKLMCDGVKHEWHNC